MYAIALLRHGESVWNSENRFTGWADVPLSSHGEQEARVAAYALRDYGFAIDHAFCSVLKRAIKTLWIVLEELDLLWVPTQSAWQLNERHYGALQGLNKSQTAEKYGKEQVHLWRRSFDHAPPQAQSKSEHDPSQDRRYERLGLREPPLGESLKDTMQRVIPYWESQILPKVKEAKKVLITAHGNSLRALIKYLASISDDEIANTNIPTAIPFICELDEKLQMSKTAPIFS